MNSLAEIAAEYQREPNYCIVCGAESKKVVCEECEEKNLALRTTAMFDLGISLISMTPKGTITRNKDLFISEQDREGYLVERREYHV